ncbi:MAG: HAD hydrolase-like protein [Cyanobacteria bacterium P01_A01_bin.135]
MSPSPKFAVFCDFDGPIVDVSDRYYGTYRRALQYLDKPSIQPLTKAQFWRLKQHRIPDKDIAQQSGVRPHQMARFFALVEETVNHPDLLHHDCLHPSAKKGLLLLHERGIHLMLVTLRSQGQVIDLLREHRMERLFIRILGTPEVQAAYRNNVDYKTELLSCCWRDYCQAYSTPNHAWMVGDTEADILAGRRLGISTVALTCGIRSRAYLARFQPTHIQDNLMAAARKLLRVKQQYLATTPESFDRASATNGVSDSSVTHQEIIHSRD